MAIALSQYPRTLFSYLKKSCGYNIFEKFSGVYEITGSLFPIQVLNINKLSRAENMWLVGLSRQVDVSGMEEIFQAQRKFRDRISLDAYTNVIVEANHEILIEVLNVSKTKTSFHQALIDAGLADEWKNELEAEINYKIAASLLAYGDSIEKISDITKIPVAKLIDYFKLAN